MQQLHNCYFDICVCTCILRKPLLCVSVLMPRGSAPGAGSFGQQAVVAHTGQEGLPEIILLLQSSGEYAVCESSTCHCSLQLLNDLCFERNAEIAFLSLAVQNRFVCDKNLVTFLIA